MLWFYIQYYARPARVAFFWESRDSWALFTPILLHKNLKTLLPLSLQTSPSHQQNFWNGYFGVEIFRRVVWYFEYVIKICRILQTIQMTWKVHFVKFIFFQVEDFLTEHLTNLDINQFNPEGRTALQQSCLEGNLPLAKILVKYGANSRIMTRDGFSTLHLAVFSGHSHLMAYIMTIRWHQNTCYQDFYMFLCIWWFILILLYTKEKRVCDIIIIKINFIQNMFFVC